MGTRNDLFCSTDARAAADIFKSNGSRSAGSQGATTPSGDWRVRRIVHDLDAFDAARLDDGTAFGGDTNSDEDESALDVLTRRIAEDVRPHTQSDTADGDIEIIEPAVESQKDGRADLIDLVSDEEEKGGHVKVASTAAIGEANVNDVDPNTSNNPSAQLVYRPSDRNHLSTLRCFIRQQIEFFEATPKDASERNFFVRTGSRIIVGQVGMRCIHCAHVPFKYLTRGSVSYPKKINGIHSYEGKAFLEHILTCSHIPQSVRDQHKALIKLSKTAKNSKRSSSTYLLQRYKKSIVEKGGHLEFSSTALGSQTPNATKARRWTCDVCSLATFTDYDDARKHEETCTGRHLLLNVSSPEYIDTVDQATPAQSEVIANPYGYDDADADADVAKMVSADKGQNDSVADQAIVLPGEDDGNIEDRNQCNLKEQEDEEGPYRFQGKAYRTYSDMVKAKRARNASVLQSIGLLDAADALRRGVATQNASKGGKKRKSKSEGEDTLQQTRRKSSRLKKRSNTSYCDDKDAEVESSEPPPRNGDSDNEEYVPIDGDSDSDDEDYKLSTCYECLQVEDRASHIPVLVCDGNGCNAACHLTCAKDRPKLTKIPQGNWFCSSCSKKAPAKKSRSTRASIGNSPSDVVDLVDCNDGDSTGDVYMYGFDAIIGHSKDANRMRGDYLFDVQWGPGEITSEPDTYLKEDDPTSFAAYLRSSGLAKKEKKYAWANDEESNNTYIDV